MKEEENKQRLHERQQLSLGVRVHCSETADREWEEMTQILDISPLGARLALTRSTEIGQLLHLTLAMPSDLRRYDHSEVEYRVWALVRHIKELESNSNDDPSRFEIGVAFVGSDPPGSYTADPATRYELRPTLPKNGMWVLRKRAKQMRWLKP